MQKDITEGSASIAFQTHTEVDVFGKKMKFRTPKTFPVLRIHGQIVMSESPQEVKMMKDEAKLAGKYGRVLVAGLGLGVILQYLKKKGGMIHVVEKNKDVIAAYRKYKQNKVDYDFIHETTIEEFLEKGDGGWDFVHLDTWYSLDYEFLPHINWMIKMARSRLHPKGKVVAWGYDHTVAGYVREGMAIYDKAKMVKSAKQENIDRLAKRLPMVGRFANWFRQDITVDRQTAIDKARIIAAEVQKSDHPLEIHEDLTANDEALLAFNRMFEKVYPKEKAGAI